MEELQLRDGAQPPEASSSEGAPSVPAAEPELERKAGRRRSWGEEGAGETAGEGEGEEGRGARGSAALFVSLLPGDSDSTPAPRASLASTRPRSSKHGLPPGLGAPSPRIREEEAGGEPQGAAGPGEKLAPEGYRAASEGVEAEGSLKRGPLSLQSISHLIARGVELAERHALLKAFAQALVIVTVTLAVWLINSRLNGNILDDLIATVQQEKLNDVRRLVEEKLLTDPADFLRAQAKLHEGTIAGGGADLDFLKAWASGLFAARGAGAPSVLHYCQLIQLSFPSRAIGIASFALQSVGWVWPPDDPNPRVALHRVLDAQGRYEAQAARVLAYDVLKRPVFTGTVPVASRPEVASLDPTGTRVAVALVDMSFEPVALSAAVGLVTRNPDASVRAIWYIATPLWPELSSQLQGHATRKAPEIWLVDARGYMIARSLHGASPLASDIFNSSNNSRKHASEGAPHVASSWRGYRAWLDERPWPLVSGAGASPPVYRERVAGWGGAPYLVAASPLAARDVAADWSVFVAMPEDPLLERAHLARSFSMAITVAGAALTFFPVARSAAPVLLRRAGALVQCRRGPGPEPEGHVYRVHPAPAPGLGGIVPQGPSCPATGRGALYT
eukprot:tig00020878_g14854.t1